MDFCDFFIYLPTKQLYLWVKNAKMHKNDEIIRNFV